MIVRWRTSTAINSRVRFGTEVGNLTETVVDEAIAINHTVTLSNLSANTRYYYEVGSTSFRFPAGPSYYFYTAPFEPKPTRIWVLGDAGSSYNQPNYTPAHGLIEEGQQRVRDAYYNYAAGRYTDVWLLLGDNAYNDGNDGDYHTNFFEIYPEVTRQSVIWPTIGNHEELGEAPTYLEIFSLPAAGQAGGVASGTERYYSFDHGNIHFVCLDSELSSRDPEGAMLTWLEEDLSANTNNWLIAFWHSPPYSKGSHDSDFRPRLTEMRQNVVPLLESYGVDLVLCGHSHVYERSYLIDGHYGFSWDWAPTMAKDSGSGQRDDTGPYLKSGSGPAARQGAVYVVAGSSGWAWRSVGLDHPAMFTGREKLGSMVIDVDGLTLEAKFLRENGTIDDHFTIIKGSRSEPLRIARIHQNGNSVILKWKTVAGESYRVQSCSDLSIRGWGNVSLPITATGATTSWTNVLSPNSPISFYQVVSGD